MRLFTKLFLNTLLAIVVAEGVLLSVVEVLPSRALRSNVAALQGLSEASRAQLFDELDRNSRRELIRGLVVSLPLATAVAAVATLRESRRVGRGVRRLAEASNAVAARHFGEQVYIEGRDELSDLAVNFNAMAQTLARTEQDRSELISIVAHELRTPLAALQGYSEALSDGVIPVENASQAISREVAALRKVASDLELVSIAEAGLLEVRPTRLDAKLLVGDAEDRFRSAFESCHITFESFVQVGLPEVQADRERAGQVLANLLANALKYTPAGGRVTLYTERIPGYVQFSITDSGPGIDPRHQPHVFERFYRTDEARGRSAGGLGVGLTVSKRLAQAMGGLLWLTSTPGQGATFTLSLPELSEQGMTLPGSDAIKPERQAPS